MNPSIPWRRLTLKRSSKSPSGRPFEPNAIPLASRLTRVALSWRPGRGPSGVCCGLPLLRVRPRVALTEIAHLIRESKRDEQINPSLSIRYFFFSAASRARRSARSLSFFFLSAASVARYSAIALGAYAFCFSATLASRWRGFCISLGGLDLVAQKFGYRLV